MALVEGQVNDARIAATHWRDDELQIIAPPDAVLARYKRGYPTREAMGALTFSEIDVRPLGTEFALAHGKFSLKRTASGGGDASGRFTLVLRKTKAGWKIIHDHSSS